MNQPHIPGKPTCENMSTYHGIKYNSPKMLARIWRRNPINIISGINITHIAAIFARRSIAAR